MIAPVQYVKPEEHVFVAKLLKIPCNPFATPSSVEIFFLHKITGMPSYNGINPGNAPSWLSLVTSKLSKSDLEGKDTTSPFAVSSAAHRTNLLLFAQFALALCMLIAWHKRLVDTIAVACSLPSVLMSIPMGYSEEVTTRLLNN